MIVILLAISAIFIAGCTQSNAPTDIVSDTPPITSNVVAVVDGEEINSDQVTAIQQLYLMQGQQIPTEDALEQIINQLVLEQKVVEENIVITTEDAELLISEQLGIQGATLEDYKAQVASQGVSYEAELENIKRQIAVQFYLESQLEGQSFEVTEEEAQEFYNIYEEQSLEEVPSYEELESQIIVFLEQQKQQEVIIEHIQELRLNSNVEYK